MTKRDEVKDEVERKNESKTTRIRKLRKESYQKATKEPVFRSRKI